MNRPTHGDGHYFLDVDPDGLAGAGAVLAGLGEHLADRGTQITGTPQQIPAGAWAGAARTAICAEMTALGGQVDRFGGHFHTAGTTLVALAASCREAQSEVAGLNRAWQGAHDTHSGDLAALRTPPKTVAWYMGVCRDGATPTDYMDFLGKSVTGVRYQAFPVGRPPAARVAPIDLAVYAQRLLDLPSPTMDRNPKITKVGGASLVGLPTWFWVTNPAATGAPTGTRSVRAEARNVWAQVDATSTGVTITSDAGKTSCTPRAATTRYAPGTSETSACTLVFTKASVAHPTGWPVTVTANWHLTWTGFGNTGADLGIQPHTWTTNVPVAEVQTIVNGVG